MSTSYRRALAVLAIPTAVLAVLTACGSGKSSTSHEDSSPSAAAVAGPTDPANDGQLTITIVGVDEEPLAPNDDSAGSAPATPGAVFTFHATNNGPSVYEPSGNWNYPTLAYGPNGLAVQSAMPYAQEGDASIGEPPSNAIPPGSTETAREGFAIRKSQLTQAILTMGTATWRGDFSHFGEVAPQGPTAGVPQGVLIQPVPNTNRNKYVAGPFTVTMVQGIGQAPNGRTGSEILVQNTSSDFTGYAQPEVKFTQDAQFTPQSKVFGTDAAYMPTAPLLGPGDQMTVWIPVIADAGQQVPPPGTWINAQLVQLWYGPGRSGQGTILHFAY